ncbi:MAG: hypothetical protein ETSY1_25600 [Candidatus Entotheonella factor]|uniref:Uncharacterized protein n=1 Tax=Entotheonella factor TaxID=1429438 RepID=W4LH72_ENTF1|nr:hypothetical protein [Candidatus Entotheonella palauensis]ETW96686.1 MAG: hypothetical protein ETSY1_25600 [Candidatus Entotheonella factor]
MTIHELIQWLDQYERILIIGFVALPVATYVMGAFFRILSLRLMRGWLALAVYVAVIPGICMAVVVVYMMFFARANLLTELNVVVHLLPIASMVATLWLASRLAPFAAIPGFDRLQGLMVLVGLSFIAVLFVHKTFVRIHFFASIEYLLVLFGLFLVAWRLAVARLFR